MFRSCAFTTFRCKNLGRNWRLRNKGKLSDLKKIGKYLHFLDEWLEEAQFKLSKVYGENDVHSK